MSWQRTLSWTLVAAGLVGAAVWALWPEPRQVELAPVIRGPMAVSILAEGITRVRDPYTINAPIAGTTTRSPVEVGDAVEGGVTVVAVIRPMAPALMDTRSRADAEAAVAEGMAAVALAEANLRRLATARDHAAGELERARGLARSGAIPQRMLEEFQQAATLAEQSLSAALAERDLAQARLDRARALLIGPEAVMTPEGPDDACCVRIVAPVSGTVLGIEDRNARTVAAGTPLLTIGDLAAMEIETDLLSADAVRVPAGAPATVERWGGPGALPARVRRIEPAAFTRVSALGIEEQRVRVHLDLLAPPEDRPGLGERFRVFVRITIWEGAGLVQVPQGALFRQDGGWAVFRHVEGRAVLTPVVPGRQSEDHAEVVEGLAAGDLVVLFPPRDLADGMRVVPRGG